jgi:hypothetical protein
MPTIGVLFGLPLAAIVIAVILVLAAVFNRHWREVFGLESKWPARLFATALVFLALCVAAVSMWPWKRDYHQWTPISGQVETATKRLLGSNSGGAMSEVFAIKFRGNSTMYRCDDTRCATAQPGKWLRLLCKKEWEYAAVDGWACRYGQHD